MPFLLRLAGDAGEEAEGREEQGPLLREWSGGNSSERHRVFQSGSELKRNPASKVEAADHDALFRAQGADGLDAEAAADHPIGAGIAAECANALLLQLIHGAFVIAASREHPFLALEDDREIRREGTTRGALRRAGHAEDDSQASAVAPYGAREAQANAAAVRALAAVTFELGVLPVQIEVERAANFRAQITIACREATNLSLRGGLRLSATPLPTKT